jgi:predicted hydrocarbon binding protein
MKRKEFLASACTLGICSCAILTGGTLLGASTASADEKEDWRLGFMRTRFARMIEILNSTVDDETKKKILESLGRACARENFPFYEKYKNDPEGYLHEVEQKWADRTEYDKEAGTIRIVGKKTDKCGCPFADQSMTPKDFCYCSSGYFKETLETVLGKHVEAVIEESKLRGGERCTHLAKIV